jgi:hypothetical protein
MLVVEAKKSLDLMLDHKVSVPALPCSIGTLAQTIPRVYGTCIGRGRL